ncbi:MAG: hypothetical protein ACRYFL_02655 [Janthinobacterium lividum]
MKTFLVLAFVFSLTFANKVFSQQIVTDSIIQPIKIDTKPTFKVNGLSYNVFDVNLLALLKSDQNNSLISIGKTVNFNTFLKEKNRIFLLLSSKNFDLKLKDISFNVDTTLQKGFCTVKTIIKSSV